MHASSHFGQPNNVAFASEMTPNPFGHRLIIIYYTLLHIYYTPRSSDWQSLHPFKIDMVRSATHQVMDVWGSLKKCSPAKTRQGRCVRQTVYALIGLEDGRFDVDGMKDVEKWWVAGPDLVVVFSNIDDDRLIKWRFENICCDMWCEPFFFYTVFILG